MMNGRRYLTPKMVAEILDTTPGVLANLRYRGEGPPWIRVFKRKVLYDSESLSTWIEMGRQKTEQDARKQLDGASANALRNKLTSHKILKE